MASRRTLGLTPNQRVLLTLLIGTELIEATQDCKSTDPNRWNTRRFWFIANTERRVQKADFLALLRGGYLDGPEHDTVYTLREASARAKPAPRGTPE